MDVFLHHIKSSPPTSNTEHLQRVQAALELDAMAADNAIAIGEALQHQQEMQRRRRGKNYLGEEMVADKT